MAAPYRKNSMMAMLDAKPEAKGGNGQTVLNSGQQYWNDVTSDEQLSPLRKHLISTYLNVSDEDAMPLVSEYFGVALSFVALGALLRASNSSMKKHMKGGVPATEEERLDLKVCSRFERMALESMLKESMERLGSLSQNAYQLESRMRDLVDENVLRDKEKVHLLRRVAQADKFVQELKALRKAEGRANERVMSIVAAKEQDWLKEKKTLQKEVEKLKETVNGMTREAKFQARRCRNPTCEHCKGIDKAARNVKGRISLRELHSLRAPAQTDGKREAPKLGGRPVETPPKVERLEIEEDRVLMKAIELKKKHKDHQSKVERLEQQSGSGSSAASSSSHCPPKEQLLKQQQDMESELASILKRVGMLKQKSYLGSGPSTSKQQGSASTEEMPLPAENNQPLEDRKDGISLVRNLGEEKTDKALVNAPEPNMDDPTLELADPVSDQEDADLVELEKAFELKDDDEEETSPPLQDNNFLTDNAAGNVEAQPKPERPFPDLDFEIPIASNERQRPLGVDDDLVALQESLSLGGLVSFPELGNESSEAFEEDPERSGLKEDTERSAAGISDTVAEPIGEQGGEASTSTQGLEDSDALEQGEQELIPEATMNDGMVSQSDRVVGVSGPDDTDGSSVAEAPENESAEESSNEGEQPVGVSEEDDQSEFADALSSSLSEDRDSSAVLVSEQPEPSQTEYDTGMDVEENWGFEDSVSSSSEGELMENQDIPVFERNDNDDDLAGELPEPEEKRVCGLETTNELSTSLLKETNPQGGEEVLKEKDNSTIEGVVSSQQQEEDLFVENIGLGADDVKPKSDEVIAHS